MQEMVDGFLAAPFWAQIGIAFFALMVVVMIVEPRIRNRRFRRRFDDMTRGLGRPRSTARDWPFSVSVDVEGRPCSLSYDFRMSGRGGSYRGPSGHLLITGTRLAGDRWPLHQVDIAPVSGWLSRLAGARRATGDSDFDGRFTVTEDGLPVRDGWLDGDTRQALGRFFAAAPLPGLIWIREGELQFIMQDPWKGIDGPVIRQLFERQVVLAAALERTERTRFTKTR